MKTAPRGIDKWQIKAIHVLGQNLGLVDTMLRKEGKLDQLHCIIFDITGKESTKDLSFFEANLVIDRLKGNLRGNYFKASNNVPGKISVAQIKKIKAQMYELKKYDTVENTQSIEKRLQGFIKKNVKIEHLNWLSKEEASDIIEGLKGLISNQKKKYMQQVKQNSV